MVCGSLWPDASEEEARGNLRRHLSELSSTLASVAKLIIVDRPSIRWNAETDAFVDAIAFESFAADPATYESALELYRGDLLSGASEDWLLAQRDRLRAHAVRMLHSLANDAMRARDFGRALGFAQRALDLGEWREDTLRLVMTAAYAMGNRAQALAEFERFAAMLASEMRVAAMHETIALRDAILADIPIPETLPLPIAPSQDEEFPMVGRDEDLAALRAAWDRASRGAGQTIFLGGEAGIGKSRLVRELARHVDEGGGKALWSHASPDATATYQPLIDVVKGGMSSLVAADLENVWFASVAGVIPELTHLRPDATQSANLEGTLGAERLREGFARIFEAIARRRPTLIILEDLHWADADTIEVIAHVARRVRGSPILLVLTHRSEETPLSHPIRSLRRTLLTEHRATMRSLGTLSPAAIGQLVAHALSDTTKATEIAPSVARVSGGNPLFALQILRHQAEAGSAESTPGNLAELMRLRLEHLAMEIRSTLGIAALIDERFTVEELAEISGSDEAIILAHVDSLIDARYLRWSAMPGFSLTFTHQLLRDTALRALVPRGRAHLHQRIARVIERTRPGESSTTALAAHHYEKGALPDEAYRRYLEVANAALATYAISSAIDLARSACRTAQTDQHRFEAMRTTILSHEAKGSADADYANDVQVFLETAKRISDDAVFEALLAHSRSLGVTENVGELARASDAVIAHAKASGVREQMFLARQHRGDVLYQGGFMREALEAFEKALQFADRDDYATFRVRSRMLMARVLLGGRDQMFEEYARLERLAKHIDDRRADVQLGLAYHTIALHVDDPAKVEEAANLLMRTSEAAGMLNMQAVALGMLVNLEYMRGQILAARAAAERAFSFMDRYNIEMNRTMLRINIGVFERRLGNYDRALDTWQHELHQAERNKNDGVAAACLINMVEVLIERGEARSALAPAERAMKLTALSGHKDWQIDAEANYGTTLVALGRTEEGIEALRRAAHQCREHGTAKALSYHLCGLVEALLSVGNAEEASEPAEELRKIYSASRENVRQPAHVCLVLSSFAQVLGDDPAARRYRFEGQTIVRGVLERIPDEETRANYAAMPFNRRLLGLNFGSP